ncbi:disease resistance protein Pikm1-TS-like isoform X3 [Oryza sativa Japonica Group]|nr:disease resistance protein Pikm1-TS-like isoform X3 [Oryza sativa Japonica Group]
MHLQPSCRRAAGIMSKGAMGRTSIMEKQEEALKEWEPLHESISKLLKGGRITDARERHSLAFMEMELGVIVAYLRMPLPPHTDCPGVDLIDNQIQYHWSYYRDVVISLYNQYGEEAPNAGLLRKAMRCFRRRRSLEYNIPRTAYSLYRECSSDPRLELPSSELMPSPHQAAQVEAGALNDHLVGIDSMANEMLRWLMATDKGLRVMAIAGPAGIGKTTLAMELHRRLRSKLVLQTILKQIMEQLDAPSPNSSEITMSMLEDNPELLTRNISEHLKDKRYFVLIDDILDESDLEIIKGAFPNNNCGSRILFTAQHEWIAGWFLSNYNGVVHKMKPLNDSDSEKLLRTKAFSSMDDLLPDNLRLLCDEILNKCRGIPLFITGMADWLKQQQHGSSAVLRVEQVRLLLKQFEYWLSFDYSYELSLSSLYLSMFPQGYVFDKDHLVMKWENDGLIRILESSSEYGELYFSELVNTNIITPVGENYGPNLDEDELCQWQVNPFVLSFLASRAAEKGLVFTSSTLTSLPSCGGNNTRIKRRLALHHPDPLLPEMLQQMDLSHTRSLLISGAVDRTTVPLDKFGYLVFLDLQGWENLKDEDLLQICKMFMLSYLSVRNTRVSKLPPQIKELCNLKALDVSQTHIFKIPSEVCELEYLEILELRGTQIKHMPDKIVEKRKYEQLYGNGSVFGMIDSNQKVLTKISKKIHQLRYLKTLATIDLSEFSAKSIQSLGDLERLEVLAITWSFHQCSDEDYQEALRLSIERWRKLKSLTIHCGLGCSMEFLGSLTKPPEGLKKFKVIAGKFVSVPRWIERLVYLTFLQITVCKQVADDVKILAGLVKLQHLVLCLEFIPEEAIVIETKGFKEIERFSLDCPVPWLTFEKEAMPKLTYLRLNLYAFPASEMSVPSGISNLEKLSEAKICYNARYINSPNVKRTVEVVSKEVAKHHNSIDLFINGTQIEVNQAGEEKAESATRFNQVNPPEDVVQAEDEAALRRETEFQSEKEDEDEAECHA